jgi:hypothetical protein
MTVPTAIQNEQFRLQCLGSGHSPGTGNVAVALGQPKKDIKCCHRSNNSAKRRMALDAVARIRLFGKLKLTKCARAERRPGHFCVRAEERFFFVVI